MDWFILSLLRAFFVSGKEASLKISLSHVTSSVTISAFYMTAIPVIILFPYVIWEGSWTSIYNQQFLYGIIGNICLNTVAHILLLTTIRRFEISYVSAILATSPLVFGIFSIVFLQQSPGLYAFFFMTFIALGGIFVELSRKKIESFKEFILHSGWLPLFIYLCLAAGATVFSKIAVTHGNPEAYILFRYMGLSVIFFVIHHLCESDVGARLMKRTRDAIPMQIDKRAMIAGTLLTGAVVCEMNALTLTNIARVEAITKFSVVLTLIIDVLFISNHTSWQRWLGVFLILVGGLGILFGS